jgi:hypothetical protein
MRIRSTSALLDIWQCPKPYRERIQVLVMNNQEDRLLLEMEKADVEMS